MPFAIDELPQVIARIGASQRPDLQLSYACALLSELAYYHVPAFEVEAKKRALLIPCHAHARLRRTGGSDIHVLLGRHDLSKTFVAVTRGIIAVGVQIGDSLFIAMRGTIFLLLSDWAINLRAELIPIGGSYYPPGVWQAFGRFHAGFLTEAVRITDRILEEVQAQGLSPSRIYVTGHSLGGAVASISELLLQRRLPPPITTIFASPRYCDSGVYALQPRHRPIHVRRDGDLVPLVPPRRIGYSDIPDEFTTDGQPYFRPHPFRASNLYFLPWVRFLLRRARAHAMECYRFEVGEAANAQHWREPLTSSLSLGADDIRP